MNHSTQSQKMSVVKKYKSIYTYKQVHLITPFITFICFHSRYPDGTKVNMESNSFHVGDDH